MIKWKFAVEKFHDIYDEMAPLIERHYREIAKYADIELNVDRERYESIQEAGGVLCFTAREDSRLIGYAIFFVNYALHSKQSLQALQDCIYIDPVKRGFGKLFIAKCDNILRDIGVELVYHHVPVSTPWETALLMQGYEPVDRVYAKRLDKQQRMT